MILVLSVLSAAVLTAVFIAPFFIEPGDRAMREKERRDCRDALD